MRRTLASWAILLGVVAFVCLPLSALAQRRGGVPFGLNWNRGRPATSALLSMSLTGDCEGATPAGLTFTRTSTATCTRADGSLVTLAAGQPRISTAGVAASAGLLLERAATNPLLYNRDLSQPAWVQAGVACTLTATGTDGAANSASLCTSSAANGSVTQALTLAAARRASSVYMKAPSCGSVEVTRDGATWLAITGLDTTWRRVAPSCGVSESRCVAVAGLTSSIANPVVGVRLTQSGCSVAVDMAQDEVGNFATSAIGTAGTAVTRAADLHGISTPAGLSTTEGCGRLVTTPLFTTADLDAAAFSVWLRGSSGNNSIFIHLGGGGAQNMFGRDSGGNGGSVNAGWVRGTQRAFRHDWSVTKNQSLMYREDNAAQGTSVFAGFFSPFGPTLGNADPASTPQAILHSLTLGAAPGGCQ